MFYRPSIHGSIVRVILKTRFAFALDTALCINRLPPKAVRAYPVQKYLHRLLQR